MANENGNYPKILIVEDNPSIEILMKNIIKQEDHWQPTTVESGADAVEAFDNGEYDVILMDVRLPVMDGIEATKQIRAHELRSGRKRTPIIAFTALISNDNRQNCLEAGMDDFLTKPSNINKILEIIYKHLH